MSLCASRGSKGPPRPDLVCQLLSGWKALRNRQRRWNYQALEVLQFPVRTLEIESIYTPMQKLHASASWTRMRKQGQAGGGRSERQGGFAATLRRKHIQLVFYLVQDTPDE